MMELGVDYLMIPPGMKLCETLKVVINHSGDLEQEVGCLYVAGKISFTVTYATTSWITELCARVIFAW